ncbi:MAG: PIN domain-containing protein [Acidobacteriota bacterium]
MIYLDTSVALAHLLAEDRSPPDALWRETLVASRLLEYELWTRLHARGLESSHGELAAELTARLAFLELSAPVLERALKPFPAALRTSDALHLASADFLRGRGLEVEIATYDERFAQAARALGFALNPL